MDGGNSQAKKSYNHITDETRTGTLPTHVDAREFSIRATGGGDAPRGASGGLLQRRGAHNPRDNQPTGTERGWGLAGDPNKLWSFGELLDLRKAVEAQGLKIEAIENFDPAHWHDVLLDGPKRKQQIENVKELIRRIGQAGYSGDGLQLQHRGRLRADAQGIRAW